MSFVRPEVAALARRWREVLGAGALALAGLWLMAQGGAILPVAGALAVLAAAGLGLTGLRRMRFAGGGEAGPGVVEVTEGQIAWFGPGIGGFAALGEVTVLSLVSVAGVRCWRLDQTDGTHLLIPLGAAGAERLFDAFAVLPGLSAGDLAAAARDPAPGARILWRRPDAPAPFALPRGPGGRP